VLYQLSYVSFANRLEDKTSKRSLISAGLELDALEPMERVMGIEPTPSAWKAEVLPLNYTRIEEWWRG
jgi:hypothetical protein